jgi:hypothetical protein
MRHYRLINARKRNSLGGEMKVNRLVTVVECCRGRPLNGKSKDKNMLSVLFLVSGLLAGVRSDGVFMDLSDFMSGTNGIRLIGLSEQHLAWSQAFAGDFNKDGIEDFVVGVPYYKRQSYINDGLALIILGGDFTDATEIDVSTFTSGRRGMRVIGGFADSHYSMYLGSSVGAAGDVNHDGYADVLIGAPYGHDNGEGAVYVIFGRAGPYADLSVKTMTAGASGFMILGLPYCDLGNFRRAVRGALGDINGDGHDDFIIGAPYAPDAGAAWIIYGKASSAAVVDLDLSNLGSAGLKITGASNINNLGGSVSNAGDVNGDGINDILIGDVGTFTFPYFRVAEFVYLIYGSRTMTSMNLASFTTGSKGIRYHSGEDLIDFGTSVTGVGDINGDGLDDFAMSAPSEHGPLGWEGTVYVVYGSSAVQLGDVSVSSITDGAFGYRIVGKTGEAIGYSISSAGDQNQDGIPDILIGGRTRAYVVYSSAVGTAENVDLANFDLTYAFTLLSPYEEVFAAVDGGKDINGDGIPDLLLGVPSATVTPWTGGAERFVAGAGFALPGPFNIEPAARPTARPIESGKRDNEIILLIEQVCCFAHTSTSMFCRRLCFTHLRFLKL